MPNNSIKTNLSKDDIISDIRITLGADFLRKQCVLVVEGEDDTTFFTGKLAVDVDLYESFSGKQGVKEIVEFFADKRVIGIQDRDYLAAPEHSHIHFYDYNCLEMMIAADDSAFTTFCYTYYQGQYSPIELREIIMKDLAPLSTYRKLNENNGWGIKFNGVNFGNLCDASTGRLDYSLLENRIREINPSKSPDIHAQMQESIRQSESLSSFQDYLTMTRGHDFLHYFHHICNHSNVRRVNLPKAKELGKNLQCAYRLNDFHCTNLYQEITVEQSMYDRTVFRT